jgi:hypothetical protein
MDQKKINSHLLYSIAGVAAVGLAALATYFVWFGLILDEPFSPDQAKWGTFGDYIGGLMNPLVAACALYWLTMSVRLQKQELSETRHELATASNAQKEQARMALLGIQLNSLSLQLNSFTSELEYVQQRMSYAVQRLDTYIGPGTPLIYDIDAGKKVEVTSLIDLLEERMIFLYGKQYALMSELKDLNELALSSQLEPVVGPHAPT